MWEINKNLSLCSRRRLYPFARIVLKATNDVFRLGFCNSRMFSWGVGCQIKPGQAPECTQQA